jgi:hypothetical protein
MTQDKWLAERLAYLRGLKAPSDQQRLLMLLADKAERTADDERKLAAMVRAEKAAERALKARAAAARIISAEKSAQRKARDHELYQSAGLLILAGLVDTRTGKPTRDRGELLGALVWLAEAQVDEAKRAAWKHRGDALLAGEAARSPQAVSVAPEKPELGNPEPESAHAPLAPPVVGMPWYGVLVADAADVAAIEQHLLHVPLADIKRAVAEIVAANKRPFVSAVRRAVAVGG